MMLTEGVPFAFRNRVVGLAHTIAKAVAQADAVVVGPPILRDGNRGLNGERGMTPATKELNPAAAHTR